MTQPTLFTMAHRKRFLLIVLLILPICFAARPSFAFGEIKTLIIGSSTITVRIESKSPPVPVETVVEWVQRAAQAVTDYYGRFPVPMVRITVHTDKDGRISHGVTYNGRRIDINLGSRTKSENLMEDWEMTHEMLHLSFPLLDDDYNWMGEGLSDYVEPIARARLGQERSEEVWRQLVMGLPKGLPEPGDKGLDHTPTWGRIYWGGALYWFLADLEIRRTTQNQRSLRDALRAILDAGGDGRQEWDLEQVLAAGDRATGTHVLTELHNRMGAVPYTPDLDALWQRLGVQYLEGRISFDDRAPEAPLRQSITAP
jgi:hypothetical protein